MLPTCRVHCAVFDNDGSPISGAVVTARLDRFEVYQGYVVPDIETATTDETGACTLVLWPNALGATASSYAVKIVAPNGRTQRLTVTVPNVADANLHEIADLPPYEGKPDGHLAIEAALAAVASATDAKLAAEWHATQAGISATEADNSATEASTSATLAASSASSAALSATNASNSATAAATSAADAAASASSASGSVTLVATQATNASASASQAATSATQASAHADIAAQKAADAGTAAGLADQHRIAAESAATTATAAAQTATTKAQSAEGSATAAASARDAAQAAATTAQGAQTAVDASATAAASARDAAQAAATTAQGAQTAVDASAAAAQSAAAAAALSEADAEAHAATASVAAQSAATSAASAAGSASAAAGSASAAAGSASDANASASSAASSASAAATSEGNASASAAAALASQTAAATSATNAANSATAASGSATLAEQFAESIALVSAIAKADKSAPCLVKTGASTISIRAGTTACLASGVVSFVVDTPVTMPTLTAGEDYSVWVLPNGTAQAVADPFSAPASAPAAGALKIGGFHYGLVAPGTTVAGGNFATTGAGMIWTQADVDKIAGINAWSIWDLRWRPAASNPRGMALVGGQTWVDIYFCGTNHITNGTSRNNTDIASGTVLPRKPLAFGGNGTSTYSTLNWWEATEIARAHEKRLLWQQEFIDAAFGVTEAQSIGGASATYPNTGRSAGYTSRYGIEQASGHHWTWGQDPSYCHDGTAGWVWQAVTGGRGSMHLYTPIANVRALFGGGRGSAANSGSRCSAWSTSPWLSFWYLGVRAACDHLNL